MALTRQDLESAPTVSAPSSSAAARPIRRAGARWRRSRRMPCVTCGAWLDAACIAAGPLFRVVLKGGRVGGALDVGDVGRIDKAMARRAGGPVG
jgi:hypothetical protein